MDFAFPTDGKAIMTQQDAEEGAWLTLRRIDTAAPMLSPINGKPMRLFCHGADSRIYREAMAKSAQKLAQSARKAVEDDSIIDVEAGMEQAVDVAVAATTKWENFFTPDGKEAPCTDENKRKLFANYPSIRAQFSNFTSERINFSKPAAHD